MTAPAQIYAELLRSITDQTLYRVARVMIDHQGEDRAISKDAVGMQLWGEYNDSIKRRIELSFAQLCETGFPIMATSKKTGYYMPVNENDYEAWKNEHMSRLEHEQEKLALIERLRLRYLAGDVPRVPEVARQKELWG